MNKIIPHGLYNEFSNALTENSISFEASTTLSSNDYRLLIVQPSDWLVLGSFAQSIDCRFVAIWACHLGKESQINGCFEKKGEYLLLRSSLSEKAPEIHTLTSVYPAANRQERHIHDMYGVIFTNHPHFIRWIRHQAWSENEFPLRKDFIDNPEHKKLTPADIEYPFARIEGSEICEVPVGPVHAGIIEPGHFRFHIAGEEILNLEERLGYVHKGIEKLAEGKSIDKLIRLAGRISGDSTVAHAWAAAKACETAANIDVPKHALFIRGIMLERERVGNHLGDIAAICNDVGFAFAYYQLTRLRELWVEMNALIFGHRFIMDAIVFGGVKNDITHDNIKQMIQQIDEFKKETSELFDMIENNNSLQDRLKTTGILKPEIAKKLGVLGYVGRASGLSYDLRRDTNSAPYDQFNIHVPVFLDGDVASRLKVRAIEILTSLNLLVELMKTLPVGEIITTGEFLLQNKEAIGLVEGWRGEIFTYVSFNEEGTINRFFPRDPSWLNWPALELLIHDNIIPDFPVCNKSINGSYSGHDL